MKCHIWPKWRQTIVWPQILRTVPAYFSILFSILNNFFYNICHFECILPLFCFLHVSSQFAYYFSRIVCACLFHFLVLLFNYYCHVTCSILTSFPFAFHFPLLTTSLLTTTHQQHIILKNYFLNLFFVLYFNIQKSIHTYSLFFNFLL